MRLFSFTCSMHRVLSVIISIILFTTPLLILLQPIHGNTTEENPERILAVSKIIDIPPQEEYYIKFDPKNFHIEEKNTDSSHILSKKIIKKALIKSPSWLRKDLLRQFSHIDNAEDYANLILNMSRRYTDEIAFSIAFSPLGDVPPVNVLRDNVIQLYEIDKCLKYVDIVDYDKGNGNFYSTLRYRVIEDGKEKEIECPPHIYYWYVVHPEITSEDPSYIYGTFWRSYLFNHNDIGYPLLREKLSNIRYMWDCKSYLQPSERTWKWSIKNHPTAIEAVSYWIGKTMPTGAYGDRPGQPNIIAHEHNGWCGELQKIAVAALRTALIPSVAICDIGEDHVWREFFERGWHQNDNWWNDGGGAVDMSDIYVYGWGKDISGIFAWKGDNSIYEVTPRYIHPKDRVRVRFVVKDQNNQPIDGARVCVLVKGTRDITWLRYRIMSILERVWAILPDFLRNRIIQMLFDELYSLCERIPESVEMPIQAIWNYTNLDGVCTFDLGVNRSYIFLIQYGNLRKPWLPARHNDIRFMSKPENRTFFIRFFTRESTREEHNLISSDGDNLTLRIDFSTFSYQIHANPLWVNDRGLYEKEGKIEFFIVDESNFEKYIKGEPFDCYAYEEVEKINTSLSLSSKSIYLVFRNRARESTVRVSFNITFISSSDGDFVRIFPFDRDIFDKPFFDIGDKVTIRGASTRTTTVYIDDTPICVIEGHGTWAYTWDTSGEIEGTHLIRAVCGDAEDEIQVELVDVSPPDVEIIRPENGAIVDNDSIEIAGVARDNTNVMNVEVSVDGSEWRRADGTQNWSIIWDMHSLEPGDHVITVRVSDRSGLYATESVVFVINGSNPEWGPVINDVFHQPANPTNESNVVVYANISENGPFSIKKVILYINDGNRTEKREMYRYGDYPVQERHEEDPLKNMSNAPLYGLELGQINGRITYWVVVYDSAHNVKISSEREIVIPSTFNPKE